MPDRDVDNALLVLRDEAAGPDDDTATARLISRLDRTIAESVVDSRTRRHAVRRRALAAAAGLGVLFGAAATGAVAIAADNGNPTTFSAERTTTGEPANPTRMSYAALRESTQRPTDRVKTIIRVLARQFPDVDPAAARGIRAGDGTQTWVIPGTAHTCFGAENSDGTGYSCVSNARAARGALSSAAVKDDGQIRAIYLVPDDVRTIAAGRRTFTPTNNVVIATYHEGSPVLLTRADGSATATGKP